MGSKIVIVNFSYALVKGDALNEGCMNGWYYDTQKGSLINSIRSYYPSISIDLIGLNEKIELKFENHDDIGIARLPYIYSLFWSIIPFNIICFLYLIRLKPFLVFVFSGGESYSYIGPLIYSKLFNLPFFMCLRNPPDSICTFEHYSSIRMILTRLIEHICLKYSTIIIHISEKSKQSLIDSKELYSKSIVMGSSPNNCFYNMDRRVNKRKMDFQFVYWGVMDKTRDLDIVIKGFAKAKELNSKFNANFFLFGDGNDLARLEALVQELKLQDIYFKGCLVQDDLCKYLIEASVAVIPIPQKDIFQYSSPLKLAEAVTLCLPIIASDIEPNQIVRDNNLGILCDHTVDSYARAFLRFWEFSDYEMDTMRTNCNEIKYMFYPENVIKDVLKAIGNKIPIGTTD